MDDRGRGGPPWVLPLVSPVFGAALGSSRRPNPAEMRVFYGFTDFRGVPAKRGRVRRASANQVTAGELLHGGMRGVSVDLS